MQTKIISAFLFAAALIIAAACNNTTNCEKPLNPNGDSELALLMRLMNDSTAALKKQILDGKMPEKFPEAFLKIHTATPTDPNIKNEEFDAFATSYTEGLKQLYESSPEDLKSNFNNLVQRCINCHQSVCPGPVKAIKKLAIEN